MRRAALLLCLLFPAPVAAQETPGTAPEASPAPQARPGTATRGGEGEAAGSPGLNAATAEARQGMPAAPGAEGPSETDVETTPVDGPRVSPGTPPTEDNETSPDDPTETDTPDDPEAPPQWEALTESPEDYAACLADLTAFGASFTEADLPEGDLRDCGIANPVAVSEILPGVALRPDSQMRCETARALAAWTLGTVVPAATRTGKLAPLTGIDHGSAYVCRHRGSTADRKMSEHAFGNAIDIMGFRFEDGTSLAIEPRADSGTIEEAFQRAVRGGACLDFTTVLGPGTDPAHANHLHLDVKARSGGYRICQ